MQSTNRLPLPNFTMVPNIVFDHWQRILSPGEFSILSFMCRKIFGYRDKNGQDKISISQMAEGTNQSRATIVTHIKKLIGLGLVLRFKSKSPKGDDDTNLFSLDLENEGGGSINSELGVVQNLDKGVVQNLDTQKKTLTKEKEQKIYGASAPSASATAERLYSFFIEKLKNINPKRKELSKGERIQWVAEFDKMLTEDNRTEEEIQKIIDWFSTDAFWIKPIKDVVTLRRNFDTMVPHISAPSTNESRNKEYIKEILESNPTQTIVEVTTKYVKIVPANKELYFANLTPIAFKEAFETLMRPYCED